MPELINTADLQTPIEALEDNLDFLKVFTTTNALKIWKMQKN